VKRRSWSERPGVIQRICREGATVGLATVLAYGEFSTIFQWVKFAGRRIPFSGLPRAM
jgi:hypothetical protein